MHVRFPNPFQGPPPGCGPFRLRSYRRGARQALIATVAGPFRVRSTRSTGTRTARPDDRTSMRGWGHGRAVFCIRFRASSSSTANGHFGFRCLPDPHEGGIFGGPGARRRRGSSAIAGSQPSGPLPRRRRFVRPSAAGWTVAASVAAARLQNLINFGTAECDPASGEPGSIRPRWTSWSPGGGRVGTSAVGARRAGNT
jgi:hypothetical protein